MKSSHPFPEGHFFCVKKTPDCNKGADDCKEFMVPDGIVSFGFGERGGIIPDRVTEAISIALVEDGTGCILRGVHLDLEGLIVVGLVKDRISGCRGD